MFAEELHVKPSKDPENALVIFKLQGSLDKPRQFKAIKASREVVKELLKRIEFYRS